VLLRVNPNKKRWVVAQLLTNSNVSLTDHDTGVVDSLGETALENLSLKASLEHLLWSQGQGVIELSLVLIEETESGQLSHESGALELSGLVVFLEGEEMTGGRSDLGKSKHDSPDFSLVLETVLTNNSEFRIDTSLLVRSSRGLSGLGAITIVFTHLNGQPRDEIIYVSSEFE